MRIVSPIAAMILLTGLGGAANAQAQCPELTRLRGEATEASKPVTRALISNRCGAYVRASLAWRAVVDYASDHQDVCEISDGSLSDLEKSHREAVVARDNVCAGRPVRPFPADIIQR
ncbi:hypothetical protein [Bradyrhizobium liaoningense]|uniref:hypothetical protein n=1 Tax=Bradyrhizobium liaoningense TaxID=43992 RepID=UPI001BA9BC4A|nr:hypothetical protein [Bradyrhizobium liaoningense]MBR0855360.1 hypothetical protein [Bradyrhizobium liaoningense]